MVPLRNFVEMRDHVTDPEFVPREKIESNLYRKYPNKWLPLYSQVKISDKPYADTWTEGQEQDRVMNKVMIMPDIENNWEGEEIERAILGYLR